jgi:hypothetical protein
MISSHETFGGTWPFAPRFFDGNGFRMHYVEEGSGLAPPISLSALPGALRVGSKLRTHGSAMARPIYLQLRTYLVTANTAVETYLQ